MTAISDRGSERQPNTGVSAGGFDQHALSQHSASSIRRYRRLLDTTSRVVGQAKRFSKEIAEGVKRSADVLQQIALDGLRAQLDRMVPLVHRRLSIN